MSVHLHCERCGDQEKTSPVLLLARLVGPGIPSYRPEIPDGWTRPQLPTENGELLYKDLCPACKEDLFRFMAGATLALDPADECTDCGKPRSETTSCRLQAPKGSPQEMCDCGCTGATTDPCAPGGKCPCPAGEADCARNIRRAT